MNYIKSIIIIFICCLTTGLDNIIQGANINNTTVSINGKIVDARNKKGIGSVDISLMGSNIGTISNSDGYFVELPGRFCGQGFFLYQGVFNGSCAIR